MTKNFNIRFRFLAACFVMASACFANAQAPTLNQTNIMTGLESPWDLAFLPDGAMLFTEKCKGLSIRLPDGTINKLFGGEGYAVAAKDLVCEGQGGLQGVAVDPKFASNRFIYVYMTSNLKKKVRTNRVIRLQLPTALNTVNHRKDIVRDIPYKDKANAHGGPGINNGGRLRFGPDGFLYVTTGDNQNGSLPQKSRKLGGKVLRITRDGSPVRGNTARGNKALRGADRRIFTLGHRNVQGIAFRPTNGQAYIAEHGPGHTDEVTALVAGGNGGWDPQPESEVTCEDNYCGNGSNKKDGTLTPMTDAAKFKNVMQPIWNNGGESDGMGPCEFVRGDQWKTWNGALLVGMMATQELHVLTLNPDGSLKEKIKATIPADRIRSLVQGPDGNLYASSDLGTIWKAVPQ